MSKRRPLSNSARSCPEAAAGRASASALLLSWVLHAQQELTHRGALTGAQAGVACSPGYAQPWHETHLALAVCEACCASWKGEGGTCGVGVSGSAGASLLRCRLGGSAAMSPALEPSCMHLHSLQTALSSQQTWQEKQMAAWAWVHLHKRVLLGCEQVRSHVSEQARARAGQPVGSLQSSTRSLEEQAASPSAGQAQLAGALQPAQPRWRLSPLHAVRGW